MKIGKKRRRRRRRRKNRKTCAFYYHQTTANAQVSKLGTLCACTAYKCITKKENRPRAESFFCPCLSHLMMSTREYCICRTVNIILKQSSQYIFLFLFFLLHQYYQICTEICTRLCLFRMLSCRFFSARIFFFFFFFSCFIDAIFPPVDVY